MNLVVSRGPEPVTVPDVAGKPQGEAEEAIQAAGLKVGSITNEYSDTVPVGLVIGQNPSAGTSVPRGSSVDLAVSAGPRTVTVPSVGGLAQGDAASALASAGLVVGTITTQYSDTVPEGSVISQNPAAGSTVSPGSSVDLLVSLGPSIILPPAAEKLPQGSFGYSYRDQVPSNITLAEYAPKRFSLITGLVRDLSNAPIREVAITVHSHPEYGSVQTDAEGRFTIPVEGGGYLTVVYAKPGLISGQRQVFVPWNDIAVAETIQMIAEDPASTTLTFDGNPNTVVTHRSTPVTDTIGTRSATMVFKGDNRAYSVDAAGNVIEELQTITTRATEYTTEASMPAKLPPTSAYTYCAELSVDAAERVRFDKPVIMWVDNFIGFPVGEIVPVGYYDRDRAVWVPSDNGLVVRLLDRDGDGIVDALDASGDGAAEDLNGDGSFEDEVAGLQDPLKYAPGKTFWRTSVKHFSPWDSNWPFTFPPDAVPPNADSRPDVDEQKPEPKTCSPPLNSYADERSRVFHEDIAIPGTAVTLHYASNRVGDYLEKITIPASGETVPGTVSKIVVRFMVAGRVFEQKIDPLPNQKVEFVWDRRDHLGRLVADPVVGQVEISFEYKLILASAGSFGPNWDRIYAFARAGTVGIAIPIGRDVALKRSFSVTLNNHSGKAEGKIAEGWTISSHHTLSQADTTSLLKGDGTILRRGGLIETVAGNGSVGTTGDNGLATEARIERPWSVVTDAAGNLYVFTKYYVRKVNTQGIITTLAGGGNPADGLGDNGLATQARFRPYSIALDSIGNLYIGDELHARIRKVDPNGIITTIAGNGNPSVYCTSYACAYATRDNVAATSTPVEADGLAVDKAGNLYGADSYGRHVWKVATNGIINTVAGHGGAPDGIGDGGLAIQANLWQPMDVEVDAVGNLYVADSRQHRIRKIYTDGTITTVAGLGYSGEDNRGYNGDGMPPTEARLSEPIGVHVDASGNLYIADSSNYRVRKVSNHGAFTHGASPENLLYSDSNGLGYLMSSAGLHEKTIDLNTGISLFAFGYAEDRLASISDSQGNAIRIERGGNGVPIAIVSPDGLRTELTVDANSHLTQVTYPDGSRYGFQYSAGGLMISETEPRGNVYQHTFDAIGRLTEVSDEEGGHWQFSRYLDHEGKDWMSEILSGMKNRTVYQDHTDFAGVFTSRITSPSGAETLYTESADGLTVNKSLPCGMDLVIRYGLDSQYKYKTLRQLTESLPSGLQRGTLWEKTYQDTNADKITDLITEKVTVNGKATTLLTDTLQAKTTRTSPLGRSVTSSYDPANLLTTGITAPGLFETIFGYDAKGRLTQVQSNTRQTTFAYDPQGNLSSATDPEGHTTSYSYDAVGRVTGVLRPDGTTLGFGYDANGNMVVLTNPSDIDHVFGCNRVNLSDSYQTPMSGQYRYFYDADRRLIRTLLPSGKEIRNLYSTTRISRIETPESNIDLNYLCDTKLGSVTNGTETVNYGYDGSLVTSEVLSGTVNQTLGYTYNSDFRLSQFTYAGGSVSYAYDNDGMLTGSGAFTVARNAQNGLPEAVSGGALTLARTFNGYGELESERATVNGIALPSWTLTQNNSGRITSRIEALNGVPTATYAYAYDALGRLISVSKDGTEVERYDYGPNGTRISEMNLLRGIASRSMTYSAEDHLLTAGGVTYEYDLDGFLTRKTEGAQVTEYDYSSRGELLKVNLPDGRTIEHVHDPMGRRVAKKVNGTITEKYLWQGLTRLLAVYDGSDNLLVRFQYTDTRMPLAMTMGAETYYLTYDQVGSPRVVANTSGVIMKQLDYDSFGNIITDTNPTFTIPFGFAGGLHDHDTGLIRFGYRDYDPDIGRWTAKDPIGFKAGDSNLYGYVLGDPINKVDTNGLWINTPEYMYDKDFWKLLAEVPLTYFQATGGLSPAGNRVIKELFNLLINSACEEDWQMVVDQVWNWVFVPNVAELLTYQIQSPVGNALRQTMFGRTDLIADFISDTIRRPTVQSSIMNSEMYRYILYSQ